jgi:hypothetical protein
MRHSLSAVIVVILLVLADGTHGLASQAQIAPTVLKCTTDRGVTASDLTVDLGKREMRWGQASVYDVIHVDDAFITAYLRPTGNVGGEVWVLDRRSGEYQRGSVALLGQKPGAVTLTASTYSGRCLRPVV